MSWIVIIVDLNDNKVKINWLYLMKIIIGIVRGDQFLYIILEVDYKYSFYCYSISLSILRSPALRVFFLFYTILVRTYVIHLLGTYVTILCNWLILTKRTLLIFGQIQNMFNASRNCVSRSNVKAMQVCPRFKLKSVSSLKLNGQLSIELEELFQPCSSTDKYLLKFMKNRHIQGLF